MAEWIEDSKDVGDEFREVNKRIQGEHYKELNQPMKSPAKVKQLNEDQINITKIYLENKKDGRIAK